MSAATAAALESVNAFPVGSTILFKHYFEGDAVFERLKPYYNGSQFRFEAPTDEFDSLRRFVRSHGYDLSVVDRPEDYYVVVRRYSTHPDGIFKRSVRHEAVDGYNCFLMKDRPALQRAVHQGATRLQDASLEFPSATLDAFGTAGSP